jgi:YfiH family protein
MQNVLRAPSLTALGFQHGFSTRQGGVSRAPFDSLNLGAARGDDPEHVAENRRRFADAVGYDAEHLFMLSQVHGGEVHEVSDHHDPQRVRDLQGDALVAAAGVVIGVRSADCVPVLLVDPGSRQVAAAHAGWRGVLAGVVPAALERLATRTGTPVAQLRAAMFPHIRRCCFEVDDALAEQLAAAGPGAGQCVFQVDDGKPYVALDEILRAQLRAAGVPEANIEDVPGCTCCDPERFFSYRRDGAKTGLHFTVVVG